MDRKLRYAYGFLILFMLWIASPSHAEQPADQADQMELSLQKCISLALESNLDISIQRISPHINDALLTMAKGAFDPSVSLEPSARRSEEPSSTPSLSGADIRSSSNRGITLGISDPVATGGYYGIYFDNSRSKSNSALQTLNPAYSSSLSLNLTQPLLEGFGIGVNKASIIIARNNQNISLLSLKAQLIMTLSEVQNSYWELVFALESLKVQQLALKQAQDLLTINQRFKEMGKASMSDILQAQSAVASREADIIAARDSVKDAEDDLKRVTNIIQDEALWQVSIVPVDAPSLEKLEVDLDESIATALENSPEYNQAKLDLQNSDISIKVAKNGKLPILDLEGSFSLNGLGGEMDEPFSQVSKADYKSWYLALVLQMPIGRRVAKADLKKSQLEKEQKLLSLKDLEQQIITETRGAVRQLQTDEKRIEATEAAEEFAKQVLVTEEKKHKLQLSTSYELLQFQANLATATRSHMRAIIDYRKSIVSLYQAMGITLEKLNVEFE